MIKLTSYNTTVSRQRLNTNTCSYISLRRVAVGVTGKVCSPLLPREVKIALLFF